MIRRPPRSTLFPYTTSSDLQCIGAIYIKDRLRPSAGEGVALIKQEGIRLILLTGDRSEEHTSELQSHSDLVCRLLLEKKKKIKKSTQIIENKRQTSSFTSTY